MSNVRELRLVLDAPLMARIEELGPMAVIEAGLAALAPTEDEPEEETPAEAEEETEEGA